MIHSQPALEGEGGVKCQKVQCVSVNSSLNRINWNKAKVVTVQTVTMGWRVSHTLPYLLAVCIIDGGEIAAQHRIPAISHRFPRQFWTAHASEDHVWGQKCIQECMYGWTKMHVYSSMTYTRTCRCSRYYFNRIGHLCMDINRQTRGPPSYIQCGKEEKAGKKRRINK